MAKMQIAIRLHGLEFLDLDLKAGQSMTLGSTPDGQITTWDRCLDVLRCDAPEVN